MNIKYCIMYFYESPLLIYRLAIGDLIEDREKFFYNVELIITGTAHKS